MTLARITRTALPDGRRGPAQRLADAAALIANLSSDLPKRLETGALTKVSLIPPRLAAVREVQRLRMAEVSAEAWRCLQARQGVAGAVLTRAALETAAVMFYLDSKTRAAVEADSLGDVVDILLRVIVGSKTKPPTTARAEVLDIEAISVLTMLQHVDKTYPRIKEFYADLCEVAHPNQMGALIPYGQHDPGLDLLLAPKPDFANQFCPLLCIALIVFESHYNHIADVFAPFAELCRRDAPRTFTEREDELRARSN